MKHLLNVWLSGSVEESKAVRQGLEEKIDSYAAGELRHAADAISCIWEISNKEDPVLPGPSSSALHSDKSPSILTGVTEFTGCSMRLPLIRSIKEGSLFDRKYWARKSRQGLIGPIYFCSTVVWADLGLGESLRSGLTEALSRAVSRYCPGREGYLDEKDEDEDVNDSDYKDEGVKDSDYEDVPENPAEPAPQDVESGSERKEEQKLPSVLEFGSLIACVQHP